MTGDTVGMLLNLDEGTLIVYKNNRRLGVMKDGLSGSYCWYVTVDGIDKVAIKEAQIPRDQSNNYFYLKLGLGRSPVLWFLNNNSNGMRTKYLRVLLLIKHIATHYYRTRGLDNR